MTVNKRRKNSRMHGTMTHGWGAKKKHRGAGNRGGRGKAGTGKRGDAKKPSYWTKKNYQGKHGFKKKNAVKVKAVNLLYLENHINTWVKNKKVSMKDDVYTVDLAKLKYNKLLSKGIVSKKFNITVDKATQRAVDKVKKAGGSVQVAEKPVEVSE